MQVYKCLLLTCDPQVSVACISSPYRGETRGGHLTTAYTIQHIKHIIIIVLLICQDLHSHTGRGPFHSPLASHTRCNEELYELIN